MVRLYLETFVAGQSFKFHRALNGLVGSVQILWKVEDFSTSVINEETTARIAHPFTAKSVWQATVDRGKIMVGRNLAPR